jgi:hypothetical protein
MEEEKETKDTEPKEVETKEEAEKEIEAEVMEQDPDMPKHPEKPNPVVNAWKKIYNFLWVSESPWSYAAFIIIAFVILRFIAFPVFLYATGYSDIAAVVSGSMRHDATHINHNFDAWLEFNGHTQEEVSKWPYQKGLDIGDVIFVKEVTPEEISVGDVVLFYSPRGQIIHRVVSIEIIDNEYFYTTKGDANPAVSPTEKDIPYDKIKGELVKKVPYLGYPKVAFSYVVPWV